MSTPCSLVLVAACCAAGRHRRFPLGAASAARRRRRGRRRVRRGGDVVRCDAGAVDHVPLGPSTRGRLAGVDLGGNGGVEEARWISGGG